jgi:hypothetical protein
MLNQQQKEILAMVEQITEWATCRADQLNSEKSHINAAAIRSEFDDWILYVEDDDADPIFVMSASKL